MRKMTLTVMVLLLTINIGSANITVDPSTLDIPVGSTGEFNVTLDTDLTAGNIGFATEDENLWARLEYNANTDINTGSFAQFGNVDISGISGPELFTLSVQPQSGITIGQSINTTINFENQTGDIQTSATATTIPVPELATVFLLTAGLAGLSVLRKRQKN